MKTEVNIKDGKLEFEIDLYDLVSSVPEEEQNQFAEVVTWDRIMDEAIKRLTGTSENWCGDDNEKAVEVLSKMEKHVLSGYKWHILKNIEKLAKDMIAHEHLYWQMYHDPQHSNFFREWLHEHNIESNYTTELKDYKEFWEWVERELSEFGNKLNEEKT